MSNYPWLTTIGLVPLVGAIVIAALPKAAAASARIIALVFSLVTLGLGIAAATQFKTGGTDGQFQLTETHTWIKQFGVSYALGVDGISLALILMSLVLVPVSILAAWKDVDDESAGRQKSYYALLLVLATFMVGVFAATDVFLFYVFFEAMLIPVYFLIGQFGGPRRQYAAVKFLIFSLLGGLIMLAAVIGLYQAGPGGEHGFLVSNLVGADIPLSTQKWLFVGFFIAFAVKAPMVPVHTWLPDAASESKPAVAVLLVGVLDKVGTYGMIRFCLELFPGASKWATPVVITLAVISIIYGALVAIGQTDMMRLIAYTSVSHFGFIVMGIFAMTSTSQIGANLYMINHGFTTGALFLFAGFLVARGGSRKIADYGGWQRVTPVLAGVFLIAGLSGLALPGLNAFVSEFLVMVGTFPKYWLAATIGALAVILAAIYILLMYKNVMTGPKPEGERFSAIPDLDGREKVVAGVLLAFLIGLGVYPKPALDMLKPAVTQTMQHVGVTDPAPTEGAAVDGSAK
ncbi:NADH-quinone oxidoreductase subunit M [Yimella sp. cx-51]|uniref:NADH-quinone oxidoreductase subunit M n=1 Tax=Yimella sp. cx-51 TaxID=2770551 RepID=UPI00165D5EF3|nr:NADH-quinone oxidoreductase subunit M [Yimella sp. cx-51]MBC9956273.1 NADH-quinone oxidoreductase subunit M [Yimella sp. cx-51]MBD2759719.1 NADH-quinone oxidoreductase subunit M [Yimella sp. cx-573]QTH38586.1 NADH-quinone oxidoreductase subunit M [Yimella sp. cx-51]